MPQAHHRAAFRRKDKAASPTAAIAREPEKAGRPATRTEKMLSENRSARIHASRLSAKQVRTPLEYATQRAQWSRTTDPPAVESRNVPGVAREPSEESVRQFRALSRAAVLAVVATRAFL